jgi:hypothetical protein
MAKPPQTASGWQADNANKRGSRKEREQVEDSVIYSYDSTALQAKATQGTNSALSPPDVLARQDVIDPPPVRLSPRLTPRQAHAMQAAGVADDLARMLADIASGGRCDWLMLSELSARYDRLGLAIADTEDGSTYVTRVEAAAWHQIIARENGGAR